MKRLTFACGLTLCTLLLGCSDQPADDDDESADSGIDADGTDSNVAADASDAADAVDAPDATSCTGSDGLPCLTVAGGAAANFDCVRTQPPPGPSQTLTLQVRSDGISYNLPGAKAQVEVFPDNVIADTCTGLCLSLTADDSGNVTTNLDTGWIAYRIVSTGSGAADLAVSSGYRVVRANETTKRLSYVTNGDMDAFASMVGKTRAPQTSGMSGGIWDCDGETVAGATIRVYSNGVEVVSGPLPTDPAFGYTDGMLPSKTAKTTDGTGWFCGMNLPVSGTGTIRVEVYGTRSAGEARQLIGCEEGRSFPNGYLSRNIAPLRSDYAAGSGCKGK